ncbi:MAG: tetratricopeptide repeat protein [Chitinophagaceae bacterium]
MKKPQWITVAVAVVLTAFIFLFGRTVPDKSAAPAPAAAHDEHDGHDHGNTATTAVSTDSILFFAKQQLTPEQVTRLNLLENSISRGDVKTQQLRVYHQLSHFWVDSVGFFQPYAWYEAEAARLENSEKSLTFAAHLFLENLQQEENPGLRQWAAVQAKDLFERSLKLNPDSDSSKVGLGATLIFGGIAENPMEGLKWIRDVEQKDSTNVYAQMTLARGALMSGQLDKAVSRLMTVNRMQPENLDAILMLADLYDRMKEKKKAAEWYQVSLKYVTRQDVKKEIEKRIAELSK